MNKIKFYLAGIFCVCLMFGVSHSVLADATISGIITDNTGAPVHGLYVDAYLNEGELFTDTSNDDGSYVIDIDEPNPITAGNYTLKIEGFGISAETDLTAHFFYCYPQTKTLSLINGDAKTENFTVTKHGMITGKVTDPDNNPIYATNLYFWDKTKSLDVTERTNQAGNYYATPPYVVDDILYLIEFLNFNFFGNTQGNYKAYVTAAGYLPKYISNLEVRDNQTTTKNITLTRKSYVTGTIKNKNHTKLNNILIQAYKFGETAPYTETVTDSNGNYQIEIGKTGSAEDFGDFSVAGQNFIITAGADPDSNYGSASKKVSFSHDQITKTGINFTLNSKNKSLHGKVKNAKGKILKDAKVEAHLLSNYSISSFDYTNSNGKYRINNLVSGIYQVTVTKGNYTQINIASLNIKKNVHKEFKLHAAGVISGYLFDKTSKEPISGVIVRLVGSDLTGITNANGYYKIANVPTGSHKIFVNDPAYLEQISGKIKVQKSQIAKVNLNLSLYSKTIK